jgi:hypothetical protein
MCTPFRFMLIRKPSHALYTTRFLVQSCITRILDATSSVDLYFCFRPQGLFRLRSCVCCACSLVGLYTVELWIWRQHVRETLSTTLRNKYEFTTAPPRKPQTLQQSLFFIITKVRQYVGLCNIFKMRIKLRLQWACLFFHLSGKSCDIHWRLGWHTYDKLRLFMLLQSINISKHSYVQKVYNDIT